MRRRLKKLCRCYSYCQHGLHAPVVGLRLFCTGEPDSHLGQMAQSIAQRSECGSTVLTRHSGPHTSSTPTVLWQPMSLLAIPQILQVSSTTVRSRVARQTLLAESTLACT